MHIIIWFALSCLVVQCVNSQYVSFQQQAPPSNKICAGSSKTSLVEHFFNLIFSEFHNQPPVCVCVQMCPDQPTYCYPNGCFKKAEPLSKNLSDSSMATKYKPTAQVSQLQQDKTKPMSFLVDSHSNFMEKLLNAKSVDSKQGTASKYDEGNTYKEMHRDPFKDRYQSIFKYKKTPKVHLRYNLREHVRHKKTDLIKIEKVDVSKTRWPVTVNDNKQFYSEKGNKDSKYFHNLESANPHYPTKFFKRDVTKIFKPREANFDEIENTTETATFSLDNLIENLIESSFGPLANDTELDLNVNLDYTIENNATTFEPITMSYKRSPLNMNALMNKNTMIILNETTNVVSINSTDQIISENRNREDDPKDQIRPNQIYKNVFNDMIASLSRHIEKNNNSSIEMLEQVLGNQIEEVSSNIEITDTTVEPSLKDDRQLNITTSVGTTTDNAIPETTTQVPADTTVTEKETSSTEKEMEREQLSLTKKSHRRILRKSQHNKPN